MRCAATHCGDALGVALTAELDLEKGAMGSPPGGLLHAFGRTEAQRVGGGGDLRCAEPGNLPGRPADLLGLEIEQGAIEGVACGASLHSREQVRAGGTRGDGVGLFRD